MTHSENRKYTILIAEDEETNFLFLSEFLGKRGYDIIRAENGLESVDIIKSEKKIDLILMDIKMPLMNGYEATRLIKELKPEIPIIAQTAYALAGDSIKAREAGCDYYLAKPIRINILEEFVLKALKDTASK
ncbi:response regulator [Bacteroidota bacterium]